MSTAVIDALAEVLAPVLARKAKEGGWAEASKHDASGTPITAGYSHGPGGHLTWPGVDPAVFHTIVGNKGIMAQLPTTSSLYTDPTYQIITGVRADSGSEKVYVCDNAPTAGLVKSCMVRSVFGRYERATPEIELNRAIQRIDRADPMDLVLRGSPIHQGGPFAGGPESPTTPADILRDEISRKLWERNVSLHRLLSRQLWIGAPANNTAGGGYKELTGFDTLINTGTVDAESGTSCPSVDSDLKNFNYAQVGSNGSALVAALMAMYQYVTDLADRTGVTPVRWVLAMRQGLFREITEIWPCS